GSPVIRQVGPAPFVAARLVGKQVVIPDDVAFHLGDAVRPERVGPLLKEKQRIGLVQPLPDERVAAATDDEVAAECTRLHWAVAVEVGFVAVRWPELFERGGGGEQLGDGGGNEVPLG